MAEDFLKLPNLRLDRYNVQSTLTFTEFLRYFTGISAFFAVAANVIIGGTLVT